MSGDHAVPWDDLKPYEQQQGGYWLYGPSVSLYGEGREFIRVTRPSRGNA